MLKKSLVVLMLISILTGCTQQPATDTSTTVVSSTTVSSSSSVAASSNESKIVNSSKAVSSKAVSSKKIETVVTKPKKEYFPISFLQCRNENTGKTITANMRMKEVEKQFPPSKFKRIVKLHFGNGVSMSEKWDVDYVYDEGGGTTQIDYGFIYLFYDKKFLLRIQYNGDYYDNKKYKNTFTFGPGIKIGSTLKDFKKAYGKGITVYKDKTGAYYTYRVVDDNKVEYLSPDYVEKNIKKNRKEFKNAYEVWVELTKNKISSMGINSVYQQLTK